MYACMYVCMYMCVRMIKSGEAGQGATGVTYLQSRIYRKYYLSIRYGEIFLDTSENICLFLID